MKNKIKSFLKILVCICIIATPIFARGYDLGVLSYVHIIFINLLAIVVVCIEKNLKIDKKITRNVCLVITIIGGLSVINIIQPYRFISSGTSVNNLIIMIDIIVVFGFILDGALDANYFIKIYDLCAKAAILFLFYQMIMYYGAHIIVSGKIPFLTIERGLSDRSVLASSTYVRFASFFWNHPIMHSLLHHI